MPKITEQQIYEIIAAELMMPAADLNIKANMGLYDIDSLHLHEFSLIIEDVYDLHLPFDKAMIGEITTVEDIAKYLLRVANDVD
jgi:acyl carrier protein